MLETVLRTIRKFRMILPGQRIAVACSGGPDSTALLLLLKDLSEPLGCTLSVAHFNHRLRGEQSDEDEQFVRRLAEQCGLPFYTRQQDVARAARETRSNLEQKARELRYGFLLSLLGDGLADRVAAGHTADDQAETVIHRFLRGAGTRGLAGIYPVVEEKIVRPLVEVRRAALLDWLQARGQPWREDASNRDLRRLRNRVRHELLPRLLQFNPRLVETLAGLSDMAREEEAFWQQYLQSVVPQMTRREGEKVLVDIEQLRSVPLAVARRVLRSAIGMAGAVPEPLPARSDLETPGWSRGAETAADFDHVEQVLRLALEGQSGTAVALPRKRTARKEFTHLILEGRIAAAARESRSYSYSVQAPAVVPVAEIGSCFTLELIALGTGQKRYNKRENVYLDSGMVEVPLTLRNWRAGDAFRPKGCWRRKKLKELFQRNRIPLREREGWPVLVAGDELIWARGLGVASGFSPPAGSRQAVVIRETRL